MCVCVYGCECMSMYASVCVCLHIAASHTAHVLNIVCVYVSIITCHICITCYLLPSIFSHLTYKMLENIVKRSEFVYTRI